MTSKPDPMEALKIMGDYLSDVEKHEDKTVYLRCAAICAGLSAVVFELREIKDALTAKPR